jgi:hypothetical protein
MTTEQVYDGDIADIAEKIRQQEIADQQAATTTSTSEQTADSGKTESTEGTTEGQGTASPEGGTAATETTTATTEQHGDVRGALRASRRAERQARERAAQLEAELEETRKRIPAPADEGVTDAELAELEADMPIVAKALKETRALKASLPKAPAPAPQAQTDFVPPVQPAHVQDAIDDIPELLQMQNDPDQSAFKLAVQTDALLRELPKWADKPLAERLAECARRVNAELGTSAPAPQPPAPPAPTTQRRVPAAAVAEAPRVHPTTLSDIAGGAAPTTVVPGVKQFMSMSDEDIMDALQRHG